MLCGAQRNRLFDAVAGISDEAKARVLNQLGEWDQLTKAELRRIIDAILSIDDEKASADVLIERGSALAPRDSDICARVIEAGIAMQSFTQRIRVLGAICADMQYHT